MSAVLQPVGSVATPLGRPLIDAAFLDDPYPTYRALRELGPIHWSEEFFGGAWLLTRHEDVERLLRDPRFSARRTGGWLMNCGDGAREQLRDFQGLFARAMLFLDAPDHGRIRQVLHAAFRPQALQALVRDVEARVAGLLGPVDASQGFDFMQQLARPLPSQVMATLMGVEARDDERFRVWSDDLADFIGAPRPTLEQARRARSSLMAMSRYFEAELAEAGPSAGGLVGCLAAAAADGRVTEGPELLAQCAMLLFAGHETTRNLLGNGLYHLLSRRERWCELQREPQRLPAAIRELLRFDSPVQYTGRRVACDLELHGQTLRRGDLVVGLIGAANRDPRRHAQPDQLDLARQSPGNLSFGSGPHVCIGAALTVIEAEASFGYLLRRWPGLRLAEEHPPWNRNPVYRGLTRLLVRAPAVDLCAAAPPA